LEETYGFFIENGEKPIVKPDQEDLSYSVSICNTDREGKTLKAVIFAF
jgi:hypothetical protein